MPQIILVVNLILQNGSICYKACKTVWKYQCKLWQRDLLLIIWHQSVSGSLTRLCVKKTVERSLFFPVKRWQWNRNLVFCLIWQTDEPSCQLPYIRHSHAAASWDLYLNCYFFLAWLAKCCLNQALSAHSFPCDVFFARVWVRGPKQVESKTSSVHLVMGLPPHLGAGGT